MKRLYSNTVVRHIETEKRGWVRTSPSKNRKFISSGIHKEKSENFDSIYVEFDTGLEPVSLNKLDLEINNNKFVTLNPKIFKIKYCDLDLSKFSLN